MCTKTLPFRLMALLVLAGFYAVYFIKMLRQRRRGIRRLSPLRAPVFWAQTQLTRSISVFLLKNRLERYPNPDEPR